MPFINAHGITQYYRLEGSGTPLVFVHGALVDHHSWDPQFTEFQGEFRVLAYDLRGHGRTGASQQAQYSVRLLADDLLALLSALGIERPLLCGLSLGGMVAQTYAANYPVAGLVLTDTLISAGESRRDELFRRVLYPRWLVRTAVQRLDRERFARLAMEMARRFLGPAWLGTRPETRQYLHSCLRQMPGGEVLKTIEAIYQYRAQPLERVCGPSLVLLGEHEAGIIRRHSVELARRLGDAHHSHIPQAGHMSNLDNPAAFNAQLHRFLERVSVPKDSGGSKRASPN